MAWPFDPLPVIVELWDGTQWLDITAYTRAPGGNGIEITRGTPDEANEPPPSKCSLTLDNRDGRFTPRNPLSPYYGLIGRNTPIRVRIGERVAGDGYLHCEGTSSWLFSRASTPGSGGVLSVTSDTDVRVDALAYEWNTNTPLLARWLSSGTSRSWALLVDTSGNLVFTWSTDGSAGNVETATSTVAAGLVNGERKALRATLDVDNGASGWTVTFYTADTINGSWVQLGSAVTDSGTTSVHNPTTALEAGHVPEFGQTFPTVRIYAAQLLDGIGGTALADVDFGDQSVGDESFVDDAGRTWTVGQEARIADPGVRFVGEVSEWPPKWEVSGTDYWTPVTAQGINRRLGQGERPAKSPVSTATEGTFPFLVAYWPMEETGGTSFASALFYELLGIETAGNFARTAAPMTWTGTRPDFASTGAFLGSQPLPILASTTSLTAPSPLLPEEGYGSVAVGLHVDVPVTTGWADNTPILWIEQAVAGSTVATWELRYKSGSGGDLEVRALDESGAELDTTGSLNVNIDGDFHRLFLRLQQSDPSDPVSVTLTVRTVDADGTAIDETSASDSFSGLILTTATGLRIAPTGGLTEFGVGHVTVFWSDDDISDDALLAFAGEYAATRAVRLLEEVGVEARVVGTTVNSETAGPAQWRTEAMGAQAIPTTFRESFAECPVADQALVFESRDELGLTFRTRSSLYNQLVALTLDFEAPGEIAPDLEPIDDDQLVRNDVTVRRKGGSSARVVDTTSSMGTAPPPAGVGIYEMEIEANIQTDGALPAHAAWRVHLGTWNEPRFPQLVVDQAALAAAGKSARVSATASVDFGDRVRLQNLPLQSGVVGDVDLLVLGSVERLGLFAWGIVFNTRPYGPWDVGTYQDTDASGDVRRYDTKLSTTAEALDTTEAGVDVTNGGGVQWGTQTPYVVEIGGEWMTVTAVSGTGASQTLTVTRSTNGVVKSHASGAQVRIAPPYRAHRGL